MRASTPAWLRAASIATALLSAETFASPMVAIILDDMGYRAAAGERALALPPGMTFAFIPSAPHAVRLAEDAHRRGHEVMVHLPMEGTDTPPHLPDTLYENLDDAALLQRLDYNLSRVPHAVGVNNHMGSLLTANASRMDRVMRYLTTTGLYFVDSRTTADTVAAALAQHHGIPHRSRDVFLDHIVSHDAITQQFDRLEALARRDGLAIAIGHPHDVTLDVLERRLPNLHVRGIKLVPVSATLERTLHQKTPAPSFKAFIHVIVSGTTPDTVQRIAKAAAD